jgi:hypothetical protein
MVTCVTGQHNAGLVDRDTNFDLLILMFLRVLPMQMTSGLLMLTSAKTANH